jgi:hypothetical protein
VPTAPMCMAPLPVRSMDELAAELRDADASGTVLIILRDVLDLAVHLPGHWKPGDDQRITAGTYGLVDDPGETAELSARWGPEPSDEDVEQALAVGERARAEALAEALEGALTREQAAERLGVSSQAVSSG